MPTTSTLFLALVASLGVASMASAAAVTNSFKTSTTGTTFISTGDTIQFEVSIVTDAGVNYNTVLWSLTGDVYGAIGSTAGSGWAGVNNQVTNWEWHYTPAGGSKVKMGTNGRLGVSPPALAVPDRVSGAYGFAAISKTGDGIPALVGTVTITADNIISPFVGGAFQYPGVDGFLGSGGGGVVPFSGGDFYVNVPEPTSALLLAMGLAGLAAQRRRPRD